MRNSAPRIVFAEQERLAGVREAAARAGIDTEVRLVSSGAVLSETPIIITTLPVVDPEAPGLISYTSGTSGQPKPVTLRHAGVARGPQFYARMWHFTADDIYFVPMPVAWLAGTMNTTLVALSAGGTIALARRFKADQAVRMMTEGRATFFFGVTTMYVKMLHHIRDLAKPPRFYLRFCVSGGEPRNEPALDEWTRLTGVHVLDCYAAAECFPVATYDPKIDPKVRPGSAGRLVPGMQLRLLKSDGTEAGIGEVGEAYGRSTVMMYGYWGEPALTRAAYTEDGWYRYGDYLKVDADGYVYVTGRASDMIKRGGANVSPAEVESILQLHPSVVEVAVVGIADPVYGQIVAAAIVLASGYTLDSEVLRIFCADRLAHYKVPSIYVTVDALPRNNAGKIVRRQAIPIVEARLGNGLRLPAPPAH
jgi:long-chain acyl-CoA synthetase